MYHDFFEKQAYPARKKENFLMRHYFSTLLNYAKI